MVPVRRTEHFADFKRPAALMTLDGVAKSRWDCARSPTTVTLRGWRGRRTTHHSPLGDPPTAIRVLHIPPGHEGDGFLAAVRAVQAGASCAMS